MAHSLFTAYLMLLQRKSRVLSGLLNQCIHKWMGNIRNELGSSLYGI